MNTHRLKSIASALAVASAILAPRAYAQLSFNPFVTHSELNTFYGGNASPIGITYVGNGFVGTGGYSSSNVLYSANTSGVITGTFGTVPGANGEVVLNAAPDGSAFGSNIVYSGSGASGNVYRFGPSGGTAVLFTNLDAVDPNAGVVRGINFDPSGLYGNDMIVTTTSGDIFEVNAAGAATLLASTHEDTEGIGFATQTFGSFAAGTMFTTSEGSGQVRAVSPTGTLTSLFSIDEAESISFVPADIGSESGSLEGFYGVNYPNDVIFAGASQFDPYAGDVIVTSEIDTASDNIYAISLSPTNVATITAIGSMGNQPEDSIFVTKQTLISHGSAPDGGWAAGLLLAGLLCLAYQASLTPPRSKRGAS